MPPARLDRFLIRVSGPDARAFLDNLLTQNVETLTAARVLYAGLLLPQGKVLADMLLWDEPDGAVLIDADPLRGRDLLRRLGMYKLRSQISVDAVDESFGVLVSDAPFEGALPDPRLPALEWRAIAQTEAPVDEGAYDARRIALGVPDLGKDAAADEVFALEALFEELNGVDFQKGCFIGRENVSRMKRRATTRKKFCPINFDGNPPAFGAAVRAGEVDWRRADRRRGPRFGVAALGPCAGVHRQRRGALRRWSRRHARSAVLLLLPERDA